MGDAGRSEAGKKGGDVAGIGDGESAGRAVVRQRENKERGSDWDELLRGIKLRDRRQGRQSRRGGGTSHRSHPPPRRK